MFWSFILSALHNVTKNSLRVIFVGIESWKVVAFPGSHRILKTGMKVGLLECFTFLSFSTNPLSYSYTIFVPDLLLQLLPPLCPHLQWLRKIFFYKPPIHSSCKYIKQLPQSFPGIPAAKMTEKQVGQQSS